MSYYDGSMVRTQVVQLYLSSQNRPSRKEETEQALRAVGNFSSDASDVSVHHDRYLAEAFKG